MAALAVLATPATACAPSAHELKARQLSRSIDRMRAQLARHQQKLDELTREVVALRREQTVVRRADSQRDDPSTVVPTHLEVVRLAPKQPPASARTTDSVLAAENEPPVLITMGEDGELRASAGPGRGESGTAKAESVLADALAAVQDGRHAQALKHLATFLHRNPRHRSASTALYWQGECHLELAEPEAALGAFDRLLRAHPTSPKAPDALLRMGLAYERLAQPAKAQDAFARLMSDYPDSAVADVAKRRLARRGEPSGRGKP